MTINEFIDEWNNRNDYIIAHTSGSTGKPKEIKLPKSMVLKSAIRTNKFFEINRKSHIHLALSPDYIAGKMMIIRSIVSGAKLTYETPSNNLSFDGVNNNIDLLAIVPSQLDNLLNKLLPFKINNLIVGGSAIPPKLRNRLVFSDFNAFETYGMTETASHIALRKVSEDLAMPYFTLPGIKISTDDRQCLVINVDNEYQFITNDIVELVDDFNFRLLGRHDNVIITGGLKVNPEEIELIISKYLPDNIRYFISSRPHDKWGEEIILVIEEGSFIGDIYRECLFAKLKLELKNYQMPKEIIFVKKIPVTSTGKLIRKYHISD